MFRGGESSRIFGFAHIVALAALAGGFVIGGTQGLVVVALLGVLEIAVSFDNAIVNATVLARMNRYWQRMFMTVGVVIAAIGMRLLLPLIIVAIGAHLSPWRAVDLAYQDPTRYHSLLLTAQPGIAAYGGIFLLMIAIAFFREEREVHWWPAVERRLPAVLGRRGVPLLIALLFTAVAGVTVPAEDRTRVVVGCLVGLVCYLGIHLISSRVADRADADGESRPRSTVEGQGAFLLFVYLELLDATFSMDSVMGAFSVTVDIALITLGLAIGAAYIRSLTVYVVRKGTLEEYRYLEHGAYYSIALLAVLLLWEVWRDVPDWITACTGAVVITSAWLTSIWAAKRQQREDVLREASLGGETATIQEFKGQAKFEFVEQRDEDVYPKRAS
ncbi:MAG TPA: DUF475 domain-containing protein [Actinospica sp.]|jgi:hypothetical protein|nr:DUF475 domain-containing protein [Actinospica sp.]